MCCRLLKSLVKLEKTLKEFGNTNLFHLTVSVDVRLNFCNSETHQERDCMVSERDEVLEC
jgi:hypothetical protein